MKIVEVKQGTPEWHALRARITRCASYAPIMMGCHPNVRRDDLVRIFATGDERVISDFVRDVIFPRGHEVEGTAREIVEDDTGEDLYAVTATDDSGRYLASFDGLTMAWDWSWEHKQWAEELAARARANDLPDFIYWQLEHQLLVGEDSIERVHFTVSDGTREKKVDVQYERIPGRREKLIAGWDQFQEDVANYQHVEVLPRAVPEPQAELPVPAITVSGEVTIESNLATWGDQLRAYIATIPEAPATDQEFANCEAACKALKVAEDRMKLAIDTALSRFADIEQMRSMGAQWIELARQTRLEREKIVEERKKAVRAEILQEGQRAYASHLEKLNARIGAALLNNRTVALPDFATAMKGKRTIASLRDAVNTTLAHAKIAANEIADRVQANLQVLAAAGADYRFLFADLSTIAFKATEDFDLLVRSRIEAHKENLRKQAEAAAEKERERIAAEERAKLEAAAAKPAPAVPAAPVLAQRSIAPTMPAARSRPTDHEIIATLARHYAVPEATVIEWLTAMALTRAAITA
jgi:hypothetical protein